MGRCVTPLPKGTRPDRFPGTSLSCFGRLRGGARPRGGYRPLGCSSVPGVGSVGACRDRSSLVMTLLERAGRRGKPIYVAVWEERVRWCLLLLERACPDPLLLGAGAPLPQLSHTLTEMKPMWQSGFGAPCSCRYTWGAVTASNWCGASGVHHGTGIC